MESLANICHIHQTGKRTQKLQKDLTGSTPLPLLPSLFHSLSLSRQKHNSKYKIHLHKHLWSNWKTNTSERDRDRGRGREGERERSVEMQLSDARQMNCPVSIATLCVCVWHRTSKLTETTTTTRTALPGELLPPAQGGMGTHRVHPNTPKLRTLTKLERGVKDR